MGGPPSERLACNIRVLYVMTDEIIAKVWGKHCYPKKGYIQNDKAPAVEGQPHKHEQYLPARMKMKYYCYFSFYYYYYHYQLY